MIAPIVKLIKALNTNSHPGEIAHAVSVGLLLGFVPKNNALWYLLFVLFLFVRIHKGAFLLNMLAGSVLAPVCDPLFDLIGYAVLTYEPLKNLYGSLLEIPFVAFTKFNNTIVAGSLTGGLLLYVPVYSAARLFIFVWRKFLAPAFTQSKFMQVLYKTPLFVKIAGFFSEAEFPG